MLNRQEAIVLLKKYLREEKLINHSLAVESIMIKLAQKLEEDEDLWGLTGLLHDLDYEYTLGKIEDHTKTTARILKGMIPETAINAIKTHNYTYTDHIPSKKIDKALVSADAVSGLIIATALILPSKKMSDIKLKTLKNKYKDKSFARGCERARIDLCKDLGLTIDDFLEISLNALKDISQKLSL